MRFEQGTHYSEGSATGQSLQGDEVREDAYPVSALMEDLVNGLGAPVAIADRNGALVTSSESMSALFGGSEGLARGEPVSVLFGLEEDPVRRMDKGEAFSVKAPPVLTGEKAHTGPGCPWLELLFWPLDVARREFWAIRIRGSRHAFGDSRDILEFIASLSNESEIYVAALQGLQKRNAQLIQSERMAGIGQLAAGVAHEINNPVGYVSSNLQSLREYVSGILFALDSLDRIRITAGPESRVGALVEDIRNRSDLDFIRSDLASIVDESIDGVDRVRQIVQSLREFSHSSEEAFVRHDLHRGIDSTLRVAYNEIKYKARVVREYGEIPEVECIPGQINQVILNLLVNAAQAIEQDGVIVLRTGTEGDRVWVEVEDNGRGIDPSAVQRLFEPFYTTKPAGQGTGLGLPLSSSIVQNHGGDISVRSEREKGTVFRVMLPVRQRGESQ